MPIFDQRFYEGSNPKAHGVDEYRTALRTALATTNDGETALKQEVVAITRTITDGIRDLITHDRHIYDIVFVQGAVPLATWTAALDKMSEHSISSLKIKIAEMELALEHGRVGQFPGTMLLYHKPIFTTFAPFYDIVFSSAI